MKLAGSFVGSVLLAHAMPSSCLLSIESVSLHRKFRSVSDEPLQNGVSLVFADVYNKRCTMCKKCKCAALQSLVECSVFTAHFGFGNGMKKYWQKWRKKLATSNRLSPKFKLHSPPHKSATAEDIEKRTRNHQDEMEIEIKRTTIIINNNWVQKASWINIQHTIILWSMLDALCSVQCRIYSPVLSSIIGCCSFFVVLPVLGMHIILFFSKENIYSGYDCSFHFSEWFQPKFTDCNLLFFISFTVFAYVVWCVHRVFWIHQRFTPSTSSV